MAALGRDARGAGDEGRRQAVEIALLQQQEPRFFIRQNILAKFCAKARQPLADVSKALLARGRKARAVAGKVQMIALQHSRLFGVEIEVLLVALQSVDAGKQRLV